MGKLYVPEVYVSLVFSHIHINGKIIYKIRENPIFHKTLSCLLLISPSGLHSNPANLQVLNKNALFCILGMTPLQFPLLQFWSWVLLHKTGFAQKFQ